MEGNQTEDWRTKYAPANQSVLQKPEAPKVEKAPKAPKQRSSNGALIAITIFALMVGGAGLTLGIISLFRKPETVTTVSAEGYYTGNSAEFEETSIAAIVSKVTPAVVSIISESQSSGYYSLFGGSSTQQSAGTGMIVTSDGYVMTNKHVVEGASKFQIVTDAGDTYDKVELVGTDPLNDVAFLKIKDAKDLPTVSLGDSKTIAVGQPVLAIGNALGAYQNTVTQGVVSGTGRSVTASDSSGRNSETLSDMIQTDAAINPGNSGGPLVNAAGDVIGINTAVSTSANGLGFAIPISATKGMLNTVISGKKAERAYLGMKYVSVTAEVAKTYDLPVSHGAYLRDKDSIISGGPADKAGFKVGDIITKIGNVEIGRAGSASTLIGEYKVGDKVEITYVRDKETKTVVVTLEAVKE